MNTDNISYLIAILRFPLAFLVVLIHCNNGGYKSVVFNYSLQNIMFLSVPFFYIISGYNFAKSKNTFKYRIKERLSTILLPYILWNTIAYIVSLRNKGFYWPDWNIMVLNPIDFPLWYLRDLFILCMIYPLIQILITKFKGVIFAIISIYLYIIEFSFPIIGLNYNSIFFFGIGIIIYEYLKHKEFKINIPFLFEYFIYIFTIILFFLSIYYRKELFHVDGFYFAIYILFAICSITFILLRLKDKLIISKFPFNQGNKGFFIYCSHCILISGFVVYILKQVNIYMEIKVFLAAIISTSICISIYKILHRYSPSILKLLNGGKI